LLLFRSCSRGFSRAEGERRLTLTARPKKFEKNPSKTPQQFELTDLSSPPLADDAAVARVLSRASDAPVALWVVSSGTQALGGVAKVRTG
jgi:hypothetical protein